MSTWLEEEAKRLVAIEGWYPYQFERIENGILVTGAVFEPITRGARKGQPNFRKMNKSTKRTVVVTTGERQK